MPDWRGGRGPYGWGRVSARSCEFAGVHVITSRKDPEVVSEGYSGDVALLLVKAFGRWVATDKVVLAPEKRSCGPSAALHEA